MQRKFKDLEKRQLLKRFDLWLDTRLNILKQNDLTNLPDPDMHR